MPHEARISRRPAVCSLPPSNRKTSKKMISIIEKYFPSLTERQKEQYRALYDLYAEWNAKINVVSRKDFDQLYVRHILHSLAIAKVCEFKAGAKVLDVGCGGGFPSVPLAIMFPDVKFVSADSIAPQNAWWVRAEGTMPAPDVPLFASTKISRCASFAFISGAQARMVAVA